MKKGDLVTIKPWSVLQPCSYESPTVIDSMRIWCGKEVRLVRLTNQFDYKQVWLCSNNYYYREEWFVQGPIVREGFLTDDLFEI